MELMLIESIIEDNSHQNEQPESPVEYPIVHVPKHAYQIQRSPTQFTTNVEDGVWHEISEPKILEGHKKDDEIPIYTNWRFVDKPEMAMIEDKNQPRTTNTRTKNEPISFSNPTQNQTPKPDVQIEIDPKVSESEDKTQEIDLAEPNQIEIYMAKRAQAEKLFNRSSNYVRGNIPAFFSSPAWQQLEFEKSQMTKSNLVKMTTSLDAVLDFYRNPKQFQEIADRRYEDAMIRIDDLMNRNPNLRNNAQVQINLDRMAVLQNQYLTHASRFFEFMICLDEFEAMVATGSFQKFTINQTINDYYTRREAELIQVEKEKNNEYLQSMLGKNAKEIKSILDGHQGVFHPQSMAELSETTKNLIRDLRKRKQEGMLSTLDLVTTVETTNALKLFFENTPEFKTLMTKAFSQTSLWVKILNEADPQNANLFEKIKKLHSMLNNDILSQGEIYKIRHFFEIKRTIAQEFQEYQEKNPKHRNDANKPNHFNRQNKRSRTHNPHQAHNKNPQKQYV
jgi:hypothetical protein